MLYFRQSPLFPFSLQYQIHESEIREMVSRAAPFSRKEGFNRRFHNWLFKLVDGAVKDMAPYTPEERATAPVVPIPRHVALGPINPKRGFALEECEACEGAGCVACNMLGEVKRPL